MIRVLFVDDEPMVLKGLKRLLFPMRKKWKIAFAESGRKALDILEQHSFDVIVSDMRMPGMDGEQLLKAVRDSYPEMVRIILTGQTDESKLSESFLAAHQFLSKPCGLDTLVETVEHAVKSGAVIHDMQLKKIISRVKQLPALPEAYNLIVEELEKDDPSLQVTAKAVSSDPSICAKLLNLANSPYFGFSTKISTPNQAVALLGINTIKTMVVGVHVFSLFDRAKVPDFSLDELWKHCLRVSATAKEVAVKEGMDKETVDACSTAGLLHDVGKLVLAAFVDDKFSEVLDIVRKEDRPVLEAERKVLGVSHAEIGGYLLGLWGMPQAVVVGVMRHHDPLVLNSDIRPAMVVHMADIYDHKHVVIHPNYGKPKADSKRIETLSLSEKLSSWEEAAQKIADDCSAHEENVS